MLDYPTLRLALRAPFEHCPFVISADDYRRCFGGAVPAFGDVGPEVLTEDDVRHELAAYPASRVEAALRDLRGYHLDVYHAEQERRGDEDAARWQEADATDYGRRCSCGAVLLGPPGWTNDECDACASALT